MRLFCVLSFAVAALVFSACGSKEDLCTQAVRQMLVDERMPPGAKPGREEQEIIDLVVKQTVRECRKEGLSREQANCILAAKTFEQRMRLIECPAIKAKKPTWLRVPEVPELREMEESMKGAPGAELGPEEEKALLEELEKEPPAPVQPTP